MKVLRQALARLDDPRQFGVGWTNHDRRVRPSDEAHHSARGTAIGQLAGTHHGWPASQWPTDSNLVSGMCNALVSTTTTTAPAVPSITTFQGGSVREPSTILMGGANDVEIYGITWQSWAATSAYGVGMDTSSNWIPDCADGMLVTSTDYLTLSSPVDGAFGRRQLRHDLSE